MKKNIVAILLIGITCIACKNNSVYSDLLKEEQQLIESYITRNGYIIYHKNGTNIVVGDETYRTIKPYLKQI